MDIKSTAQRSKNMAKICSKNTKPEVFIRSLLHKQGLRYRANFNEIIGKPDLYFTKKRVAVFVHGCFWHRHADCKMAYTPKSNTTFWQKKFSSNIQRDIVVHDRLLSDGIRILVIWECTVRRMMRDPDILNNVIKTVTTFISNEDNKYLEL